MKPIELAIRRVLAPAVGCLLFAVPALASDPRLLIERGNEHYSAGRYEQALEAYKEIPDDQLTDRNRAEVLHDRAAAHFKLGQLEEARELWVRAAGMKDARFEAEARYNLGNCDHAEALKAAQAGDAKNAIDRLGKALEKYRDAIRLDPNLANARANLELASQLKKQIEEQATTQPSSQPNNDQKNKDDKNQQSQPSSQPQDQQDQKGDGKGQNSQPSSQPESQPSDSDNQEDKQDQQQNPQSQPSQSQPSEEEEQNAESQPSAESQPANPKAAQSQPSTSQPNQQSNLMMSPQEAERLLQMIRDAEKQRREVLRRREAAKYRPVDRDW